MTWELVHGVAWLGFIVISVIYVARTHVALKHNAEAMRLMAEALKLLRNPPLREVIERSHANTRRK